MKNIVTTLVVAVAALSLSLPAFAQEGKPAAKPTRVSARKSAAQPDAPVKLKAGQGTVNVNKAPLAELVRVPGIGNSLAERILEQRKEVGKFADLNALTEVKGIGEKKLARLKPFLSL